MKTKSSNPHSELFPNDKNSFSLESKLLLHKDHEEFLTPKRVQLLENITVYGSISQAAKTSDITYKTAWAWIEKMNALAPKPLVQKISGGKGGGGTIVTAYAKELVRLYEEVEALHKKHLDTLERAFGHLEDEENKNLGFSRLNAKVAKISKHDRRVSVELRLECGSMITAEAPWAFIEVNSIQLESPVSILIEAESVSVSKSFEKEISSRNKLMTKVKEILIHGQDVLLTLSLKDGSTLMSQITYASYEEMKIKEDDVLLAVFKAYSITLLKREE